MGGGWGGPVGGAVGCVWRERVEGLGRAGGDVVVFGKSVWWSLEEIGRRVGVSGGWVVGGVGFGTVHCQCRLPPQFHCEE